MLNYIMLLLNNMVVELGANIDSGFANRISLEIICVFAIVGSIRGMVYPVATYSQYYFRMYMDRHIGCVLVNACFSSVIACVLWFLAPYADWVFYIDSRYAGTLVRCLRISLFSVVAGSVREAVGNMMIYMGKNRQIVLMNVFYYAMLIGLDILAVLYIGTPESILAGTVVTDVAACFVLFFLSGLYRRRYAKGDFSAVVRDGFPMVYNRILSRASILLINVSASRLGTVSYAVVSVCRRSLEVAQACLQPVMPMLVLQWKDKKPSFGRLAGSCRKYVAVGSVLFAVMAVVTIVMVCGDLSFGQLFLPAVISVSSAWAMYIWFVIVESMLSIRHMSEFLKRSGNVRIVATVVICLCSLVPGIDYWTVLLYSTITDFSVSLYGTLAYRRYVEREMVIL